MKRKFWLAVLILSILSVPMAMFTGKHLAYAQAPNEEVWDEEGPEGSDVEIEVEEEGADDLGDFGPEADIEGGGAGGAEEAPAPEPAE